MAHFYANPRHIPEIDGGLQVAKPISVQYPWYRNAFLIENNYPGTYLLRDYFRRERCKPRDIHFYFRRVHRSLLLIF